MPICFYTEPKYCINTLRQSAMNMERDLMTPPKSFQTWIDNTLSSTASGSTITTTIVATAIVLLVSFAAFYISRRIARSIVPHIIKRTRTDKDNILVESNLFNRLTLLVPALMIQFFMPIVLAKHPQIITICTKVVNLYFIVVTVMVIDALVNSLRAIYQTLKVAREIPLTGFFQVIKIVLYFGGGIFIVSVIFNRAPVYLFSGLGALTAVLMLIFKDPILGFVAGIQLISNRMLKQGDWIEMPKYAADGDVIDITLTTVKVRNWDKTITMIPTYALISDSFKNWRGMQESGGRRIKRSIHIDINTIRFCSPEMLDRFTRIRYISDYMKHKEDELKRHNAALGDQADEPVNARRLTNIGTFRAYVTAYLKNHSMISQEMTFLVRQLAPDEHGLPLEIYVFCKDKAWANYEAVQSDIFDHLLAIAPEFDLRVFQYPSGNDIARLKL